MKQLRQILVWLTISALVLSLVGCGNNTPTTPQTEPPTSPVTDPPTDPPITAEQVYASVADAMAGAQATRLKMVLSYEMAITEGTGDNAVTTEVFMDMTTDTMISANPFGAYSMTEMLTRTGDAETGYKMENYYVEENDSVVLYIGMLGFWSRIDTYQNANQYMISLYDSTSSDSVWSGNPLQDMTLDENTSSLNGVEVYILRGSIPAGDLGDAFSSLGVSDPSILKDLSMPVVYYVDAQTCQILRMEANFAFLADILDDVIVQSMAIMEDEDISFDLTIPDVVYELEYGIPRIPAVPQEAYDYISGTPDPTIYDGPLLLECGNEVLELRCPMGMEGSTTGDGTNVWMYNERFTMLGDYYYMPYTTREDIMELAKADADALAEDLVRQGAGPLIEGYETWVVIGDGNSYYYAWREAGDGLLLVAVMDYSGTDNATNLLPEFVGYLFPYSE